MILCAILPGRAIDEPIDSGACTAVKTDRNGMRSSLWLPDRAGKLLRMELLDPCVIWVIRALWARCPVEARFQDADLNAGRPELGPAPGFLLNSATARSG